MAMKLVLVLSILVKDVYILEAKPQNFSRYEEVCRNLTAVPFFQDDLVVGGLWRVYYAWNMILGNDCLDIRFNRAKYSIIQQFQKDMQKYIEGTPNWSAATLIMTTNNTRDMLLIPDKSHSNSGRFVGVPNIHIGNFIDPTARRVPIFKTAMKLFHKGRYLLIADCSAGLSSFLVRRNQKHTWNEVRSMVRDLSALLGRVEGHPACKFNMAKRRQSNKV